MDLQFWGMIVDMCKAREQGIQFSQFVKGTPEDYLPFMVKDAKWWVDGFMDDEDDLPPGWFD